MAAVTKTITVGGREYKIRALTGAELDQFDAAPDKPARAVAYLVCGREAVAPLPHPEIAEVVKAIYALTFGSEEQEKN